MITIRDVAREVGVSITTVSRALTDPEKVAPATRERIVAAADALGYTPNRAASGLRAGRTNTIGLLVPDLSNPYFAAVAMGIAERARVHKVAVFVTDSQEDLRAEVDLLRGLVQQTDGVVLCSPRAVHEDQAVIGTKPLVVVNHELPGAQSVAVNDLAGVASTVDHLYSLGHRRIAYVGGPATSWSDARRRSALAHARTRLPDLEVVELGAHAPTVDGGNIAAGVVVASGATAVITFNDLVAIGLVRRVHRLGLRVPHDLSVVGFDDTYLADLVTPALTSVHGDLSEIGRRATDLLLAELRPPRHAPASTTREPVLLPVQLVVRESTAPLLSRTSGSTGARPPELSPPLAHRDPP
ncbi:LacI family DNA-binding transcriptional regulator [Pengzhenrongella sicca]|uniref:LacI family DNA-binding transcriptional regulator n=1 Tax=Pengzhenrongella sicca TaxID=2819238 RepID=A0A8A4ZGT9_9MICO|nr:LacI family DNA-binding transcriptional regulator [Pengzhenrongella sicca]QTE29746.1 LacI family DNA-binding transcriptional regulator [Pengzhenrongella sicca]